MDVGTRERLIGVAGVTVAEAPCTYLWLRLDQAGHEWWGLLILSVGLLLETVVAGALIQRQRNNGTIPAATSVPNGAYQKKVGRLIGGTTVAEIGLWVLWLALAEGASQVIGAVVLLVLMHLKHHVEFVAARDTPFPRRSSRRAARSQARSKSREAWRASRCCSTASPRSRRSRSSRASSSSTPSSSTSSRASSSGATSAYRGAPYREATDPRLQTRLIDAVVGLVNRIKPLARLANRIAINRLCSRLPPRPNPLSTKAPYTSWTSLTERKWSGRHLPPVAAARRRRRPPVKARRRSTRSPRCSHETARWWRARSPRCCSPTSRSGSPTGSCAPIDPARRASCATRARTSPTTRSTSRSSTGSTAR